MTPSGLINKLRNLLKDNSKPFSYARTFYSSKIFKLEEANVIADSLVLEKNGVEWGDGNWNYDSDTNKVTIQEETGEELESGDVIAFSGNCYKKYSDSELESYIKNALYWLSVFNYETYSLGTGEILDPEPSEREENLIVIVASILGKGNPIVSYRTPEFTIVYGERMSLEDKIKNIIDNVDIVTGSIDYIDLSYSAAEDD